ncbi:hypothetical protein METBISCDRAFT_24166 [Metschnikowia bicuspidata]|uniref:Uncharacterized protein n=1 Tax=Metschnikowia bicuspidata TaxID=27322 RepID=A0A4P9Z9P5_9ASCO|nr:hypothetical protein METBISCDRAFT_24166 [Metschnikowia bicuspidata]
MKFSALFLAAVLLPQFGQALCTHIARKSRFLAELEPSLGKRVHKRFWALIDGKFQHEFDSVPFLRVSFGMEGKGEATMEELRQKPGVKNIRRLPKIKRAKMEPKNPYQPLWNPDITTGVQELHHKGITG